MVKINIKQINNNYRVERLTEGDINLIYDLCSKNTYYYQYCPPFVTKESIKNDMSALPPNKSLEDKYYIGFFDNNNKLVAIMDLIVDYPKTKVCYIGLFMLDITMQKRGIGSSIISELFTYLYNNSFESVELAFVENNDQAKNFWLKSGFTIIGEQQQELYKVICMKKDLKKAENNEL